MSKYPNWTPEEIALLKETYPIYGKNKVLLDKFPGRNLDAIALKASRLGLKVLNNVTKRRSNEDYVKFLEDNTDFVPLETYKGSTTPILHMCGICDHEWLTRPQSLMRPGAKCPVCDLRARTNCLNKVMQLLSSADMELLSEYTGALSPITLKHKTCGHIWSTKYSYVQQGSGCPVCNKGFGYYNKENYPEKATLYILDVIIGSYRYLKIGITSRSISKRINEMSSQIGKELILIKPLLLAVGTGKDIISLEQELLSNKNIKKVFTAKQFNGCTELRSEDSLDLAYNLIKQNKNVTIIQTCYSG
jgi:hypothetical protein